MKRFGLLGYPLGHTLSPQLHRLLAEQQGQQISYDLFAIPPEDFEQQVEQLFSLDGFNITIPYKVPIIERLDELDASARNHGAAGASAIIPTASALSKRWRATALRYRAGSAF